MPLKALIFDFDGVILDTETPEYQTWQSIYSEFGLDLPMSAWEKGMGSSLQAFDPLVYLEERLGRPVNRQVLKARQKAQLLQLIRTMPPLPGIEAYLSLSGERGLKVAVASSSGIDWVSGNLERLGILHHFHALCTKDDVAEVKPDPALYRLALERLGVGAGDALAVEDSPNGIRAARAAGIFCVAVPTPVSRDLDLSQANLIVPSLADLPLERICALLDRK